MDRRQIALKLTVDGAGLPFTLETFEHRLILQKAIYFAQALGIELGYYFRWYHHGPYSPALARDAFAVAAQLQDDDISEWRLDPESQERAGRLGDFIAEGEPGGQASDLERLASVHFLVQREGASKEDIPDLCNALLESKKKYADDEVSGAVGQLHKYGLL